MKGQERLENVVRWENMNKDIFSKIFKKLDVVDVLMGASRVCISWFLASHDKTIWNTIKLTGLDSILFDDPCPYEKHMQDNDREKYRYRFTKILVELNKFARTVPINFFFNVYCNVQEEHLAIISKGMPNIRKLALAMWKTLDLKSIKSAFSKWKNLHTLIIAPLISQGDTLSLEFKAIADNCRNLKTMKIHNLFYEEANIIVRNFPNLERLSCRGSGVCNKAAMSVIIGLPKLKILNLSHCVFTGTRFNDGTNLITGMTPKDELVKTGTQKLERFIVCRKHCKIYQEVWKYTRIIPRDKPEFRNFWEKEWKIDEIKELEFLKKYEVFRIK